MNAIINFIVTYWIGIGFGIVISVSTYFYKVLVKYRKMIVTVHNGVRILLKGEIIRKYYEYKQKGILSIYEKQLIEELYVEYTNLGGNGIIKSLYDELRKFPVSNGLEGD